MEVPFGQKLLEEKLVTEQQLARAVERKRLHGGRLGQNLIALGYVKKYEIDMIFRIHPPAPQSIEDCDLDPAIIEELILKHILFLRDFKISDVADKVKLPVPIVDSVLQTLRRQELVEIKGGSGYAAVTYVWKITEQGKKRAMGLFDICRYVGPAPVSLDAYRNMVISQSISDIQLGEGEIRKAFSHLVLQDGLLDRLGPAVSSGRSIFLYGPAGNGKTAVAEAIGGMLPDTVYLPYAIAVGGQIITVYDQVNHERKGGEVDLDTVDGRWVACKRPVIITGGELTLNMLDLDFNSVAKFYQAPLQMKANNGLFIADDFGRQQVDPRSLLNRWIVPLERKMDFMTLNTGMKFEIPFDVQVVFSTNSEPKELVDEAFLRRIRYKFKIGHPSREEFEAIFRRVCDVNGIEFKMDAFVYLIEHYQRYDVQLSACHPRDMIDQIVDHANFHGRSPEFTRETIDAAWRNYFVNEETGMPHGK